MSRFIILILWVFVSGTLLAQEASIIVLSATSDGTAGTNDPRLRGELQRSIDNTLATDTYGSLGCHFKLEPTSSQQMTGIAKRTVARYAFTLSFIDYVLNVPVGDRINGAISGSGDNAQQAAINALQKLRKTHLSESQLRKIITDHRNQLPECGVLLSRLEAINKDKGSTAVLAVCAQLNGTGTCTVELENLAGEIYEKQQASDCRQLIIRAKAEVVAGNLPRAARLLAGVDPTLDCAEDVEDLLDELMKKDTIRTRLGWYNTARQTRTLSPATRRRIISNLVLEYAYQNY
jgi:hypothetical protein